MAHIGNQAVAIGARMDVAKSLAGIFDDRGTDFRESIWYENRFDWFSLLKSDDKTEPANKTFGGDNYSSLMTSRTMVEALR
jgi:hypothetical protein